MSSDVPSHVDPSQEVQQENRSTAEITIEFLKKTWWLLLIAFVSVMSLLAVLWIGAPWRELGLAVMIASTVGPFLGAYIFAWIWYVDRESRRFTLLVDDEHESIGLLDVARDYWQTIEVDDGSLGTRDSKSGKVYIAESFEVKSETQVDPDTGEEQTVPVPTLEASWEAEAEPLEFIESRETLKEQRETLVPLVQDAVKARAAQDMTALDNAVKQMHSVIAGAENDEFVDLGVDPFDWDTELDVDGLEDEPDSEAVEFDEGPSDTVPRGDRHAFGLVDLDQEVSPADD